MSEFLDNLRIVGQPANNVWVRAGANATESSGYNYILEAQDNNGLLLGYTTADGSNIRFLMDVTSAAATFRIRNSADSLDKIRLTSTVSGVSYINNGGLFVIGSTAHLGVSSAKLAVSGESQFGDTMYIGNGTGDGWISFSAGSNMRMRATTGEFILDATTNIVLQPGLTEAMRVTTVGNVGIGTSTPTHKLTVSSGHILIATANNGIKFTDSILTTWTNSANGGKLSWTQNGVGDIFYLYGASNDDATVPGTYLPGNMVLRVGGTLSNWLTFDQYSRAVVKTIGDTALDYGIRIVNSTLAELFNVNGIGEVFVSSLAGTGTRVVNVDSTGKLVEGVAAGSAVDGSGTTNYIPKWSDTNTLTNGSWIFNGNDIYPAVSGSNIGNDTSPDFRIGTIYMASNIDFANNLNFNSGGNTNVTFTTGGSIGIGTSNPTTKLEVSADNSSSAIITTRYQSSILAFANFGGRKARGTAASPTAVLALDGIAAFNAIGYSGAAFNAASGRIAFTAAENFTATASGTNFYLQLAPIGSLAPADVLSVQSDGIVTVNSLAATGDRLVEADTNGALSATRTIITTYGVPNTEKLKLENAANWDVNGVYTGTAITGTYQGQKHYDDNYFYEAVADNYFIRLIRG